MEIRPTHGDKLEGGVYIKNPGGIKNWLMGDLYEIKQGNIKGLARIAGDEVEDTHKDSFVEGLFKGAAVALTNVAYPLLATGVKAISSYKEVAEVAKDTWRMAVPEEESDKGEGEIRKVALKGAFVGAIKGALHGALDAMVIGGLTAGATAVMGPVGFLLAPVIGGVYNVVKDALRRKEPGIVEIIDRRKEPGIIEIIDKDNNPQVDNKPKKVSDIKS